MPDSWWETLRERRVQPKPLPARSQDCLSDLQVLDFVEGMATSEARDTVLSHLEVCAMCQKLIAGLMATSPERCIPTPEPPEMSGPYRFGPKIAQGGMGRIYQAKDTRLGRDVAIKVPSTTDPGLLRRFEREVAITAMLQHPGVVPVHGAGELRDGTPFYVMKFIDGIRLDQAVDGAPDRKARLALVGHLVSVAETMAYVHAERIAHRDLKPNNVLIGKFGETVIIDWGLAKLLAPHGEVTPASRESTSLDRHLPARASTNTTHLGDVLGTPAFMSPEQTAGEPIDQRADVYALGVMLAFVINGTLRPVNMTAEMPTPVAAVYTRAVRFDPVQRYEDAGAFAAALRQALEGERARGSRRRLIATLALAAAVSAGAVAVAASVVAAHHSGSTRTTLESIDREPLGARWIALSPSGTRVAYSGLDRVEIKDLVTKQTWSRPGSLQWPQKVQFDSDDSVMFAIGGGDVGFGHLVVWNFVTGASSTPAGGDKIVGLWLGRLEEGDVTAPSEASHLLKISHEVIQVGHEPIVQVSIAPARRRLAFVDTLTTTSSAIRIIDGAAQLMSLPITDLSALAWLDDDTLLYAAGSGDGSKLYRVTATAIGLLAPTVLYAYRERDNWIGAIAAADGRIVMSLMASTFETHMFDRTATLVDDRLDPVSASAPLGWLDESSYLTWNRTTNDIELHAHDGPAARQATVHGEPANTTRADEMLIVASRAETGRRVDAFVLGETQPRWSAAPGTLSFVRCAGDSVEPCVAGTVTHGQIELREIDPRSGVLGKVVVAAAEIEDAAIDPTGTQVAWVVAANRVELQALDGLAPPTLVATHLASAHSLAFSPRGGVLVSRSVGDVREIVRFYDSNGETLVRTGATIISMIRPSPSGDRLLYRTRALSSELAELRLP